MRIQGEKVIGELIDRPNRFTLRVKVNGKIELAHLRDPGRLGELIDKNRKVLLKKREKIIKTKYEVLAINHEDFWVFTNSGYHSDIVEEELANGNIPELSDCKIKHREVKIENSRIDFLLDCKGQETFLEVKGCTLVIDKVALFPDAPTKRGTKHVRELLELRKRGYRSIVFFAIMRPDAEIFSPNGHTDPEFTKALIDAINHGVEAVAYKFSFDGNEIKIIGKVPICLDCYKRINKKKLPTIKTSINKRS